MNLKSDKAIIKELRTSLANKTSTIYNSLSNIFRDKQDYILSVNIL